MSLRVAFRVDASTRIGTGHFMRCLTLARKLIGQSAYVRFISRQLPEHLQQMIYASGCDFKLLITRDKAPVGPLAHSSWLGTSQAIDANDSITALDDHIWDWLVVDHYAIDQCWESKLRNTAKRIFVIDDIADRKHDCDVLLDQNYYIDMGSRYINRVPQHCELLLGPKFALIRDEFIEIRKQLRPRDGNVKNILIFFGGIDANNYTSQAIQALINLNEPAIAVNVVIGAQHPFLREILDICSKHGFACHVQTSQMAELMGQADFSIGAGGSAIWERCCLGLPTMAISTVNNQNQQIADAASKLLVYSPKFQGNFIDVIARHVKAVIENRSLISNISSICMDTVDGLGIARVLRTIESYNVDLRQAARSDLEQLFEWRNHEIVREFSRSNEIIKWEEHETWFDSMLADNEKILLIGYYQNNPIGVFRFDIDGNEAEVSLYLVQNLNSRGFGRPLLRAAESWLVRKRPGINILKACVLGQNIRSHHLFSSGGYKVDSTSYSKRLHNI